MLNFLQYPGFLLNKVNSFGIFSELQRRSFDPLLKNYTRTFPFLEICRHMALKFGIKSLTRHEKGIFSIDSVYRNLDNKVASNLNQKLIHAIYAYEDGALNTFCKAKEKNSGYPEF